MIFLIWYSSHTKPHTYVVNLLLTIRNNTLCSRMNIYKKILQPSARIRFKFHFGWISINVQIGSQIMSHQIYSSNGIIGIWNWFGNGVKYFSFFTLLRLQWMLIIMFTVIMSHESKWLVVFLRYRRIGSGWISFVCVDWAFPMIRIKCDIWINKYIFTYLLELDQSNGNVVRWLKNVVNLASALITMHLQYNWSKWLHILEYR